MYRKKDRYQPSLDSFFLPFEGRLSTNNRWVKKAELIPSRANMKFTDRRNYYECFTDYHQRNDNPEAMVELVIGYVEETLNRYLTILN